MKKGKFGFVLCAYPIVAFAAVILRSPWICAAAFALAVFAEQDEWAGRQTLQAWMLSLIVTFFNNVLTWAVSLISIPFFSSALSVAVSVISALVYIAAIIVSIIGILRVMKGQEANLVPLSELADKFYGKMRPKPVFYQQPYQGTPQNGQPPYQQPPYPAPSQSAGPRQPEEPKQ